MSSPTLAHSYTLQRVLRYLSGTRTLGLYFPANVSFVSPFAFADAAEGNKVDHKCITGYAVFLSPNSSPIVWRTKKQDIVAQSITEAEYIALNDAKNELIFVRALMQQLCILPTNPSVLYGDNVGSLFLTQHSTFHQRTKHIARRYHSIREAIHNGTIYVTYCPTQKMLADVLTKPLPESVFSAHISSIMSLPPS
jgi:hypothetical protein